MTDYPIEYVKGLKAEIARLRSENERLRAIVERLPKTADGVLVFPGDIVFWLDESGCPLVVEAGTDVPTCDAYSTRAAALEAAKEQG